MEKKVLEFIIHSESLPRRDNNLEQKCMNWLDANLRQIESIGVEIK
jgi:hypothetical protein